MANTLTITDRTDYKIDGTIRMQSPQQTYTISTTSDLVHSTVQVVGTTAEVLSAGDCTDTCYATIENLHATNSVQYGYDNAGFVPMGTLLAGDPPARLGRLYSLAAWQIKASDALTPVLVSLVKIVS